MTTPRFGRRPPSRRWFNEGGRRVDQGGRRFNQRGRPVDRLGRRFNQGGRRVDRLGRRVNQGGRLGGGRRVGVCAGEG
jgi:hypothetical protein